jgi:hypothetical protein
MVYGVRPEQYAHMRKRCLRHQACPETITMTKSAGLRKFDMPAHAMQEHAAGTLHSV